MNADELLEKNRKISFLLGMASMFLMELDHELELPLHQKERIKNLMCKVSDLFYGELSNCVACIHVADGMCHTASPEMRKCVKCGDFY